MDCLRSRFVHARRGMVVCLRGCFVLLGVAVCACEGDPLPPVATASPDPSSTATSSATASSTPSATASPSATPSPSPEPPFAVEAWADRGELVWGLQLGLEFDAGRYTEAQRSVLPLARETGLRSIRTTLRWDQIEPSNVGPGAYDWAETDRKLADYSAAGFDILVSIVAYPAWATEYQCGGGLLPGMDSEWRELVHSAVERYSRPPYRVAAWEIGNEVDGESIVRDDDLSRPPEWGGGQPTTPYGGCWGGRAEDYAAFLRSASEEIRAVHPEIPVTIGGLAYADVNGWFDMAFLDAILAAGAAEHFDFLGYHWFPNVRDAFPHLPSGPEKLARLEATLERYGASMPIWLTETYRFSVVDQPETRLRQVDYLTKELVEVLGTDGIRRIYWYSFVDFPDGYSDNERGLLANDYSPKPAFPVLAQLIAHSQGRAEDFSTGRVRAYRFTPAFGEPTVIAWTSDGNPARLEIPAEGFQTAYVTWFPKDQLASGNCCAFAEIPAEGGLLQIELGADTRFVSLGTPR